MVGSAGPAYRNVTRTLLGTLSSSLRVRDAASPGRARSLTAARYRADAKGNHLRVRPLWADFLIAALVFCAVLLPLEYGGESAVVIAAVVAGVFLVLLLLRRLRRERELR
jgi:Flp pilus assembly protein TadB